jgi:hypothetical protein
MTAAQYDFRKAFENKTEAELEAMTQPPELDDDLVGGAFWRTHRREALDALRQVRRAAPAEREPPRYREEPAELVPFSQRLYRRRSAIIAAPLDIPEGSVADLLERQIGICAGLMNRVAEFVAAADGDSADNFTFMTRISEMLTSSASAARVVGQLRGIATETRQTFVTRKEGAREGGGPQP